MSTPPTPDPMPAPVLSRLPRDPALAGPGCSARAPRVWVEPVAVVVAAGILLGTVGWMGLRKLAESDRAMAPGLLQHAVRSGSPESVDAVLASYDTRLPFVLPTRAGDCATFLHLAAERGEPRIVRSLVEAGDIPAARSFTGRTAFAIAIDAGHPQVIPALYGVPEDPGPKEAESDPWQRARAIAMQHGDLETACRIECRMQAGGAAP